MLACASSIPATYTAWQLDGLGEEILTFVKREGQRYPGNVGHHAGTTAQEVLRALVDRVQYVDSQIPDSNNVVVLASLRKALWHLEARAAHIVCLHKEE